MISESSHKLLETRAWEAMQHSYSPYSNFKVGAALSVASVYDIVPKHALIYTGTNVENASYGLTICAERAAIFKAVSEIGSFTIKEIAIVCEQNSLAGPCGACRQVISEFSDEDTIVRYGGLDHPINNLLPDSFGPRDLS